MPPDNSEQAQHIRQLEALLRVYKGVNHELGVLVALNEHLNYLMDLCKTGENQFGSYWNTRKLMRVLHAYDRVLRSRAKALQE